MLFPHILQAMARGQRLRTPRSVTKGYDAWYVPQRRFNQCHNYGPSCSTAVEEPSIQAASWRQLLHRFITVDRILNYPKDSRKTTMQNYGKTLNQIV